MEKLTETQLGIIKVMIRNQFEILDLNGINYVLNEGKVKDLIDLAKYYGFYELAVELTSDYLTLKQQPCTK
jgi:hypothetical protein